MGDAAVGRRHRGLAFVTDRAAAHRAGAVGSVVDAHEGAVDQRQLGLQRAGQDLVLALLSGDLAAVGEVVVVVEVDLAPDGQFVDLDQELSSFVLERGADVGEVVGHGRNVSSPTRS